MSETAICPVAQTLRNLQETLDSHRITVPRAQQRAESLLELMEDVSRGRGGSEHFPAMESLANRLLEGDDEHGVRFGRIASEGLARYQEVYESHIATHNCPTGDCDILTPAPCQMACPAGIDVSSYVSLIGQGLDAEAVELIRKDNPFPWVCGLVCTHPCEFMCVRGRMDRAIAIKDLKAFAAERAMSAGEYINPPKAPDNGRKVCIIGAGPAGLTAAYYLALKGYSIT
ncbi:MAG: hypothetical protein PVH33_12950, partial [Syntrophobacterales bacterium]